MSYHVYYIILSHALVCLQTKALNTQGKTVKYFYVNKAFRGFKILFDIVTITICSLLTALSILLC